MMTVFLEVLDATGNTCLNCPFLFMPRGWGGEARREMEETGRVCMTECEKYMF